MKTQESEKNREYYEIREKFTKKIQNLNTNDVKKYYSEFLKLYGGYIHHRMLVLGYPQILKEHHDLTEFDDSFAKIALNCLLKFNNIENLNHFVVISYIKTATNNTRKNLLRDRDRVKSINDSEVLLEFKTATHKTPELEIIESENAENIKLTLNKLSPEDKYIIDSIYFNERTQVSLAKELGISTSTLHSKLKRAEVNFKNIFMDIDSNFKDDLLGK